MKKAVFGVKSHVCTHFFGGTLYGELRYVCYNAGHRCYGHVIMTTVDIVID